MGQLRGCMLSLRSFEALGLGPRPEALGLGLRLRPRLGHPSQGLGVRPQRSTEAMAGAP